MKPTMQKCCEDTPLALKTEANSAVAANAVQNAKERLTLRSRSVHAEKHAESER
jgi:hypothetical protein